MDLEMDSEFTLPPTPPIPHTPISRKNEGKVSSPLVTIPPSPMMKKLGRGTGVSVYLLSRPSSQGHYKSPWAVKKVNRNYRHKSRMNQRMEEEARMLQQLSHPNIIGYRGIHRLQGGDVVLMMEKGGKSLMDLIDERREQNSDPQPFSARDILDLTLAVGQGLCYLHSQCVLHGDVKSGNILVPSQNFSLSKLCDLGTALVLDENLRNSDDEYIGTEAWCSKEILDNNYVTDRADIFALGMVMYEMMTLSVPHMAEVDDDDDEWEEEFLNRLGTRPQLPEKLIKDNSYRDVIDVFIMCSEEDYQIRPSAKDLVKLINNVLETNI